MFKTLYRCMRYMGMRSYCFIASVLSFSLVDCLCLVLQSYGLRGIIDGILCRDEAQFLTSMLLLAIRMLLWLLWAPLSAYLCDWASKKSVANLRLQLAEHIIHLPLRTHETIPEGSLLSIFTTGIDSLQTLYDGGIFFVINSFTTGLAAFVLMIILDWRFAVIVLVLNWSSILLARHAAHQLSIEGEKLSSVLTRYNTQLHALMRNLKHIHLLGREDYITKRYTEHTKEERSVRQQIGHMNARLPSIQQLISGSVTILVLIASVLLIVHDLSDIGSITALVGLKSASDALFIRLGGHWANMQSNLQQIRRIEEVQKLERERDEEYQEKHLSDESISCTIQGNSLSFAYEHEHVVLHNIDFVVNPNTITAIIGPNGSGKTTLAKILAGLYPPDHGYLIHKGSTNTIVSLSCIRESVAYIPQRTELFAGSIYENILMGRPDATKDDVIAAAKEAQADDFIQTLPQGYDTNLRDWGQNLSGGQRQRIMIARALLKESPILICDEITSALDEKTAEEILCTLRSLTSSRTIILITHSDHVLRYADHLIVLT